MSEKRVPGFTEEEMIERINIYKRSTGFNTGREYEEHLRKNGIINYPETRLRLWKMFDEVLGTGDGNE